MKRAGSKSLVIFIIVISSIYFIGKAYANKVANPFIQAKQLEIESAQIFNSWTNATLTKDNFGKYLSDTRDGISKLEKAKSLNFGYESLVQKHYQGLFDLRKEMYETDLQVGKGTIALTAKESQQKVDEYQKRIDDLKIMPLYPFWMSLYSVDI